ncbi:MAG: TRAP transporter substrate-binding protein DctP [Deltaproteobacteria bacterium]|nr:TRAP transporter substrate-binding protein DctP [Deltaproteobacteria bacterium]MBW1914830.1 TRAP transporter substrate-binding protein DctP [Deltaproteobacteria bacterium]
MRRSFWVLLVGMFFLFSNCHQSPPKVYKWRLQAFMPPADSLYSKYIAVNLVEKIKAATGGQVEITPFPGGALVPPTEILKSVANGVIQMGYTATGYHVGFMPAAAVADGLPMSFRNYEEYLTCYRDRGLGDLLAAEYKKNGVHLLTVHCTESYTVLSSKPLTSKSAWKGAKVRGWGPWNVYFGKLGASAVNMPLKDVYMALSMGTIDGCITGINPHWQLKHYEVCKYGLWPPFVGSALHDIYINQKTWNALSPELQKAITRAAQEWTDETAKAWADFAAENKKNLSDHGVEWVDVDNSEWLMKNAKELWQDAASRDASAGKAVKIMTDYLQEIGTLK